MSKKLKMPEKGLFGLPSSVRQANNEENPSTQVLGNLSTEKLKNLGTLEPEVLITQVLELSDTRELNNSGIEIPENHGTEILKYPNTQALENIGTQEPENHSTEQPKNLDTEVTENSNTTKDTRSTEVLPKKQKDKRKEDNKRTIRKQASVHLSGSTLKALHLFSYQEGLEKSEVMEKALRKFIPKKFFE